MSDEHRAATQLELFFDLTFVVAIASATLPFAHRIAEGEALDGLAPFIQVVFAIWWAWMNFTWFASAYDNNDAIYRLLVMLQMAGVLVLAAGVPSAADGDLRGVTVGYLVMRVGLVALWLRAAHDCDQTRHTALRYAAGVSALEVGWVGRLLFAERGLIPDSWLLTVFVLLAVAELCVPWWAEHSRDSDSTTWHPRHIAERYGLFAIILLGEGLVALSAGSMEVLNAGVAAVEAAVFGGVAFVLTMALWWLYFLESPVAGLNLHRQRSFWWGYGHFGVFASLAALASGVDVVAQHTAGHIEASSAVVGYAVAIPVATFLVVLALVNGSVVDEPLISARATLATASVVLAAPLAADMVGPLAVVGAVGGACCLLIAMTAVERSVLGVTGDGLGG